MPAWLDPEGKAEWKRVVKDLDRIGLLCLVDRATVAAYCQAWAEFAWATREIQREGRTVMSGGGTTEKTVGDKVTVTETNGQLQPHPAVAMQRSALSAIKSFSALFGLDPSSRSRIQAPGQPDQSDPMELFLSGA